MLSCVGSSGLALAAELLNTPWAESGIGSTALCNEVTATSWRGKNVGSGSTGANLQIVLRATWRTGNLANVNGTIISETLDPEPRYITVDPAGFHWAIGSSAGHVVKQEEAPGKLIVVQAYTKTVYNQSELSQAEIDLAEHVNAASFSCVVPGLTGISFPAETLLYLGPVPQASMDSSGDAKLTIIRRFLYAPNLDTSGTARGWNWYFRAEIGAFDQLKDKNNAVFNQFPSGDFSGL
jgi:hypothetical protein